MNKTSIPKHSDAILKEYLQKASESPRRRFPKIMHQPGDEFNQVFNFMMEDTYMQPHMHPGIEKIEKMYLVRGSFAVLFFNETGKVEKISVLENGGCEYIEIPAFVWHTYVMLKDKVITYETMMGKFDPKTWKTPSKWAPGENTPESKTYLDSLKMQVLEVTKKADIVDPKNERVC
jgi:cupin fold WbuC family metalloprotein